MPRPDLSAQINTAPLTIATVAQRLGVAASTIRTWERRYGLGPTQREPGKRRRYNQEEFHQLEQMVRLVQSGVFPSDAAKTIKSSREIISESDEVITVDTILEAARNHDFDVLQRDFDVLIARDGLLHTWSDYICPALRNTYYPAGGDMPGYSSRAMITHAALAEVFQVAKQASEHAVGLPHACPTLIVSDAAHELRAHVVGAALQWEGVPARIVPVLAPAGNPEVCPHDVAEAIKEYRESLGAHTLILIGSLATDVEIIKAVDDQASNLILVGNNCPISATPRAMRFRTLPACVEETVELARNCNMGSCKTD
ncbi:MAG: MerR family transcriptional regulator [Actinomycetaceae bacterium]|nr:MerR family transcriptional regulator [Actinomycetaceae bacterium]